MNYSLSGLGDRKPTALLRHIRSLNADPATLLRALFLTQLPHEVRQILAASGKTDLDQLAADADRIMEVPSIAPSSIAGIKNPQRQLPRPTANNPLCFYHAKFGNSARKCHQKGCSMGNLVTDTDSNTPKKVSAVGHRDKNTMTVLDRRSGRTFLVDCGADFSVLPASKADKAALPQGDPLMAANGSPIRTWGKKTVTLRLDSDRYFTQEFYIAEVTEPILGADFFINNDLAIDMNRRRLISMADLTPIPTKMAERIPSVTGIHAPSTNTSDRIIAEFPELLIPRFKPSDTHSHNWFPSPFAPPTLKC